MSLRRISFSSIPASDQDRALAFYRDVLGFDVQSDVPYERDWRWVFLHIPGSDSRIQFARADDIEAACGRSEERLTVSPSTPQTSGTSSAAG